MGRDFMDDPRILIFSHFTKSYVYCDIDHLRSSPAALYVSSLSRELIPNM